MKTRAFQWLALVTLAASILVLPTTRASAYCILNNSYRVDWTIDPIPVWVSYDAFTRLSGTSIGETSIWDVDDEVRWVKAAIDEINSASADSPRLYYAGLDNSVPYYEDWNQMNVGITVSTYGACSVENTYIGEVARTTRLSLTGNKAWIKIKRGYPNNGGCNDNRLWWVDPGDYGLAGFTETLDFQGVLVHELGHALGLGHAGNTEDSACMGSGYPWQQAGAAVMRPSSGIRWRRRLRRDDIEGLRVLYGAPERQVSYSYTTVAVPQPLNWYPPQVIAGSTLRTNTPVSLSNASRTNDSQLVAGFTNADDEVRYFNATWPGWDTNAAGGDPILNGTENVYSWERVVVAEGIPEWGNSTNRRTLYAWLGGTAGACCENESIDYVDNRVRWRVHADGQWLAHQETAWTKYKNYGVGYDPHEDLFVLAYIDVCEVDAQGTGCTRNPDTPDNQWLFVRTIKAWLGGGGCTQALTTAGHVLAVGDVSCDYQDRRTPTRCVIPVATTDAIGGPEVRFIEGTIEAHDNSICFVRQVDPPLTSSGRLSLGLSSTAMDGYNQDGALLGGHVPGFSGTTPGPSAYAQIFTMDRATGWLDGGVDNARTFVTDYWPLHVGSMTRTGSYPNIQWRVITY